MSNVTIEDFRALDAEGAVLEDFSVTRLAQAMEEITKTGVRAAVLVPADRLKDMLIDPEWPRYFDPETKHVILSQGRLGVILGANVYSDGYMEQIKRFLTKLVVVAEPIT